MSPRDGSWNLRGLQFLHPETVKSWVVISFTPQVDRLENLGREIIQAFRAVGMSVPSNPPSILVGNPQGDVETILRNAIDKASQDFRSPPDLILIVLKASSIPIYHAIKQALDVVQGIASQVMVAEKVFKDRGVAQYLANISMKVGNSAPSFMVTD
jgi:eukaryotic translation initiation factor 2C